MLRVWRFAWFRPTLPRLAPPQTVPVIRKTSTFPLSYDPAIVESKHYQQWSDSGIPYDFLLHLSELGLFKPRKSASKPVFSVLLPPPNVTGSLHIGHSLTVAIQDILVRWRRMHGDQVVWVPGTDHAGIATQSVVEKWLMKERGLKASDMTREAFLSEAWKWKQQYGDRILQQLKLSGASLDWDRLQFTLNEEHSKAVTEAFVRLHEVNLIYRAARPVMWCPHLRTVISDIEVDYITVDEKTALKVPGRDRKVEFGELHQFAYPLEASQEEIVVATTRVETMFGDVGIAVHPNDGRYKNMIGRYAINPFTKRRMLIVADEKLVDPSQGTGAVKLTPAHSVEDYECSQRHNLPLVYVIGEDGNLTAEARQFAGMDRFDARRAVISSLKELGLYRGSQAHPMRVAVCSRSGDVLEPMVKSQWFVNCKEMAAKAAEHVRSGRLDMIPEQHRNTWFQWLDNIHDWCISRQLRWGHRIPAYFDSNTSSWIVARDADTAQKQAAGDSPLLQDDDVLDTWFSSAILPLTAFGWPNQTEDLKRFYPLTLMETGSDILFFWVARMVMMCEFLSGEIPFKSVLLHPMVRDAEGRKMSKSLGNVVDPLHVIHGTPLQTLIDQIKNSNLPAGEINQAVKAISKEYPKGFPQCGSDALRFALASYLQQGRSINMDINRVESARFFCNKIWNAFRFALGNIGESSVKRTPTPPDVTSLLDKYILSRLAATVEEVTAGLESKELARSTTAIQTFFVNELCDVYVEFSKIVFRSNDESAKQTSRQVLLYCMDTFLRLAHPFLPFLTEELWSMVGFAAKEPNAADIDKFVMISEYPSVSTSGRDVTAETEMERVLRVVAGIRRTRSSQQWSFNKALRVRMFCQEQAVSQTLRENMNDIAIMVNAKTLEITNTYSPVENAVVNVLEGGITLWCSCLDAPVGVSEETRKRLEKRAAKLLTEIEQLQSRVADPNFTKAKGEAQALTRSRLAEKQEERADILKSLG